MTAGTGAATLVAGAGNDIFVVNSTKDVVVDPYTMTTDLIMSSATFTLPTNVTQLTLTGTGNVSGTGNAQSDTITANSATDTLLRLP